MTHARRDGNTAHKQATSSAPPAFEPDFGDYLSNHNHRLFMHISETHGPAEGAGDPLSAKTLALLKKILTFGPRPLLIERATILGDRARGVPAGYLRLVGRRKREKILLIGVAEEAGPETFDGIISAGLAWLASYNRHHSVESRARQLWFIFTNGPPFPLDRLQTTFERLSLISAEHLGARIECYEFDREGMRLRPFHPASQIELLNAHPRQLFWPLPNRKESYVVAWRERILALAPKEIEVRPRLDRLGEFYAINGLKFARVVGSKQPGAYFGVAGVTSEQALDDQSFDRLRHLVSRICAYRQAQTLDRRHPFYRLRTEGWLESLLRRDIGMLDPRLDPRFIYSQIPTWRADERSVLDLLAVDRDGRLVVIEIKATEDAQLPLQGLDYWLRVDDARRRGEFAWRGLFPGLELADAAPRLYLVTPRLRFHRHFDLLARAISPRVEVYRLGLNAEWRRNVRVLVRERVN